MNIDRERKLHERLTQYVGDAFDICSDIYTYISESSEEERVHLFSLACREYGVIDSDGTLSVPISSVSNTRRDELKASYGKVIDALLDSSIRVAMNVKMDEDTFYKQLWENIVCNSLFSTEEERLFALYYIMIDKKIPYFTITNGLAMENKRYQSLMEDYESIIQKIKFILAVKFDQRTQEASNLLDILLAFDDYDVQVMLLSRIVAELRSDRRDVVSELLRKITQE